MNKKLEMIELEPYEAPALYAINAVEVIHGAEGSNPTGSPDPSDEDDPGTGGI